MTKGVIVEFLRKLRCILADADIQSFIHWNDGGTIIVIPNKEKFASNVLKKYFMHKNFTSFMRQMHNYGFRITGSCTYENVVARFTRDSTCDDDKIQKNTESVRKLTTLKRVFETRTKSLSERQKRLDARLQLRLNKNKLNLKKQQKEYEEEQQRTQSLSQKLCLQMHAFLLDVY